MAGPSIAPSDWLAAAGPAARSEFGGGCTGGKGRGGEEVDERKGGMDTCLRGTKSWE